MCVLQLHAKITCEADMRLETEITVGHVPLTSMQTATHALLGAEQLVATSLLECSHSLHSLHSLHATRRHLVIPGDTSEICLANI